MMRPVSQGVVLLVALAVVANSAPLLAASARTHGSLTAAAGHDRTTTWYEANHDAVFRAANCHVLQDLGGGQYLVQTNTRAGACQYVIQETRERRTTKEGQPMTIYRVKYVRNVSGRLADFELTIAMTGKSDDKTEVGMWIYANVSGRFVPVSAVSTVLEGSRAGVTRYILENAR